MSYYIGIDLGTSAMKLILSDKAGKVIKETSESYAVSYPQPGWSEQSPRDWWLALTSGVKKLIKGISPEEIKGIGIDGQMHGLVILDEYDSVIRPAILWNDGRTAKETEYLNNVIGQKKLTECTANIAFAGFTAPKILWLKSNEPRSFERISKVMLPKDYLNYMLTGVHATDLSDASGMLLLDVKNKRWSEDMLEICGLSRNQMPDLYESYEKIGTLLPEVASELGLCETTLVCAGAGDNASAAIGTGTIGAGGCNISLGTSGTVFISSDKFTLPKENALHSFCHADGGYHLMGCILSAASCNKWFVSDILGTGKYAAEEKAIAQADLGENHVFFLPYLMGERSPINDTDARGLFIGMRADTERHHMVQAVLEGVAFAIKDNLQIAKGLGIDIKKSTVCGGGAKSELWKNILANVLDIELREMASEQGAGLGAAMLAMVACGEYKSVKLCCRAISKTKRKKYSPDPQLVAKYEKKYKQYKKIYPAVKQLYKEIK